MKVNKEALVKHNFWIILGVFTLLWLIAVCMLGFTAGAEIKKNKDAFTKAKKDVEGIKNPKNLDTFLPPWKDHQAMFQKHKDKIWEKAWTELQSAMYTWPDSDTLALSQHMKQGPDAPLDLDTRQKFRDDLYGIELRQLEAQKLLGPVDLQGGFEAIMEPVKWDPKVAPTREEIWLAQENFWVKRDLLAIVREVLDGQARMTEVAVDPNKEPLPEGILSRHRFRNTTWEIELLIEPGKDKRDRLISTRSRIMNIHPGKRTLPLSNPLQKPLLFRIVQDRSQLLLEVTGEPLPPALKEMLPKDNKEMELPSAAFMANKTEKQRTVSNIDFQKPFTVEQDFDWYSSPIKRLDKLKLGHQSSRTVTTALKPNLSLPQDGPKEEAAPSPKDRGGPGGPGVPGMGSSPGAGAPMGGPPPGKGSGMGMNPLGGGTGGGTGSGTGGGGEKGSDTGPRQTPTAKIERYRYLQVQYRDPSQPRSGSVCRHLPLGMVLIVDQAIIPDVLAAVANSRLRIQVTQVQIQHVHNIKPPEKADAAPASAPAAPPTGPAGPMPMGGSGGMGGPAGTAQPAKPAVNEEDPNLVELGIYGISCLYDHYDPNKPPAGSSEPPPPGHGAPGPGKKPPAPAGSGR